MPTQTFPCPFCGKKMGVGIELLGKKVRCPHCNQILVAPAPVATAVPVVEVAPPPPPPTPPPPPEPIAELPTFNLPTQEARESIFGETEEESDDVFSSSDKKLHVPEMPAEEPPAPVARPVAVEPPPVSMPVAVEPPAPPPPPEPAYTPTVELNENPFAGLEFQPPPVAADPPPPPVVAPPVPPPAPVPLPVPPAPLPVAVAPIGATPPSSANSNPWAGMDQFASVPAAVPTVVPVPVPLEASPFSEVEAPTPAPRSRAEDAIEERPAKRVKPAPASNPMFKTGFFILAGYALLATVAAIYGLFLKSGVPATHPLSNLPDNFGEFPPAERKKTGRLPANLDADLPADQKVALGGTLNIGQLEIAPLGVEERKLKFVLEGKTGGKPSLDQTPGTAIVLKMRIKNTSDDLVIHPLDPAFNRKVTGTERIGTNLVTGKATYQGGAIEWPLNERLRRKYEEAQVNDATPLKPGEAREFVVFSNANQQVVKAVKEARDGVLWRVQVRRGRIDFDGKDIPVTAIVGIEFKPSDVKTPD